MIYKSFRPMAAAAVVVASVGSLTLTGCVDHDYDLSKGIDRTITLGGKELHLPACSTAEIQMGKILDLDANSPIKAITSADIAAGKNYGLNLGDYLLLQTAEGSQTSVKINQVSLNNIKGSNSSTRLEFPLHVALPEIPVDANFENTIDINADNLPLDLKSLSDIKTDLTLKISLKYSSALYKGTLKIKEGYTMNFDPKWTVSAVGASAAFLTQKDAHTLAFAKDCGITSSSPLDIEVRVSRIDLSKAAGEGLVAPGKFKMSARVAFNGTATIDNPTANPVFAEVDLLTATSVPSAKILEVTGVVDPAISVPDTKVDINDIPDFLSSNGNNLDVANPQIYFTIHNNTPVAVEINAMLIGEYTDGTTPVPVGIGAKNGTQAIVIRPDVNGKPTVVCLSRTGAAAVQGVTNVSVPNLGKLLSNIPDRLVIKDIKPQVEQKPVTFVLSAPGSAGYSFSTEYEAVVPLVFGPDMKLTYDDSDSDWNTDLEKYNFNEVRITMNAISTIPLNMTPSATLLGKDGKPYANITVDTKGSVLKGGSLAAPTTSPLTFIIKSNGENIKGLDGIKYEFTAAADSKTSGVALNEGQGIRFTDVKVSILGGVTIDLNGK